MRANFATKNLLLGLSSEMVYGLQNGSFPELKFSYKRNGSLLNMGAKLCNL
jgi:hypothetical protein